MRWIRDLLETVRRSGILMVSFLILGFFILLFTVLPLLNMVLADPPQVLAVTLLDKEVQGAIKLSLYTATITTVLALLFGVPLAYLLARNNFLGKSWVDSIVDLPILVPHAVAGIALITLFGPRGWIGQPLDQLGVVIADTVKGIILAQLFVSSPFLIKTAREAFESIDPALEKAARTLGATHSQSFFRISLPLASPGIITGCFLTWARAISEFGAVIIIAYTPYVAPVLIYRRFVGWGLAESRPIAVILILICLSIFLILRFLHAKSIERSIRLGA